MSSQSDQGEERVIAGSKRPDGTYRKERRVRAGYVPQDEQPVYQSKGALFKQNVPLCPGLDDSDAVHKPVSKSAKKNAKRKEKKQSETADSDTLTEAVTSLSISDTPEEGDAPPGFRNSSTPAKKGPASDQAPASVQNDGNIRSAIASDQDTTVPAAPQDTEKQLRNLRKKIRQAEATASKAAEGKQLTAEEQEKLHKLVLWREEEQKLTAQLT